MSSRLFQRVIHQMHNAIDRTIGVIDGTSVIIACSELGRIGEVNEGITPDAIASPSPPMVRGYTCKSFGSCPRPEHAVFVSGSDSGAMKYVNPLSISLSSIEQYYSGKYDRNNLIRSVILDNILPGNIYLKACELHFNSGISRMCMLIKISNKSDISAYDVTQNPFPGKSKDFIININETDIVLIKEIRTDVESKDLDKLVSSVVGTLSSGFYTHCAVGIGTIVIDIRDLAHSFKEAQVALEAGKVFDTEKSIVSYDSPGIARLIYQLSTTLYEVSLKEVLKHGPTESPDRETLFTIQRFFEDDLNVSEAPRKLFAHHNTLVHRLEKIKKITGLDLREFGDATVFKVALMVKKYFSSNPVRL